MPTLTAYAQELNHYVRIETIGVPATGSNETLSLYVFEQVPDNNWTPAATQRFISGLRLGEGFSQSVDILGGIADVSGIDFEVQDFRETGVTTFFWAALMATERWNADPATFPHTFLTGGAAGIGTALDRNDGTANVQSTAGFPAAPSSFWIGTPGNQECVRYTGTTATTFTGLVAGRGQHSAIGNTFSRTHRVGVDADGAALAPVLITTRPQSFFGLRFAVYAIARRRDETWEPEGSAVRRYTGIVRHVDYVPERNGFRFRCDSMLEQLDRELYSVERPYKSRIAGIYLGPRAVDRRFTIWRGANPPIDLTLSSIWYASTHDLADAINAASASYYETNSISTSERPFLLSSNSGNSTLPEDAPPDTWYWVCPTIVGVDVDMSPGIRNGLGFGEFAIVFTGAVSPEAIPAAHPWPSSALYWPPAIDYTQTLRVESSEGVLTDQGDIAAGPLLIGGLYSARVTGTLPDLDGVGRISVRSLFDGLEYPGIDHARGIAIAVDENGQSFASENDRTQGTDVVEQVFVPRGDDPLERTMRRILASTGTSGYNGADDLLADGYGIGIDDDDFDAASIRSAFHDAGLEDDDQFRYLWRAPYKTRDLLEEIGKTLGVAFVVRSGQIVARTTSPFALASAAVATITDNDLAEEDGLPAYSVSPANFYSGAELTWQWNPISQEFSKGPLIIRSGRSASGAENRLRKIESKGLVGSAASMADNVVANLVGWLAVFDRPQASVRLRLSARWASRLVPTDIVAVTLSELHNRRTGGYGTTAVLAIVTAVKETWREAIEVDLLILNEQRLAPLNPSALLDYARGDAGWDAVNNRLYLRDNEFTDAPALDVTSFVANDRILVCQDNPADPTAPILWQVTVLSVTNGGAGNRYLTLTGALPAPAFDANQTYFVTLDTYDVVPSARYDDGTWIADDADSRIGATTDWYPFA